MEIAATAGALGAAGYYFNKDNLNNRQNQFTTSPSQGSYPNTENIYTSNNVGNSQYNDYSKAINNWNQSKKPKQTNLSNNFNQKIMNTQTNPVKFLERPSHTRTQNHRDSEKNESDNFMTSSLTGLPMKKSDFKHNNMVPFFGSQVRQNTNEYANNHILENFTGVSEYDKEKQEISPLFDPQKNFGNVYGTPNMDESVVDRFIPSRYRQNEFPIEKQNVGPGLNKGYTTKPSGGFQQADTREYMLPKDTNELRAANNPKLSFKGRVTGPAGKISKPTLQGKVNKNNPDTYFKNSPDRYFVTKGAVTGETKRPSVINKNTNRQLTTKSYTGAPGPADRKKPSQRGKYKESNKNTYQETGFRNVSGRQEWGANDQIGDYGKDGMEAYHTERETTEDKTYTGNIVTAVKAIIAPLQDLFRTTKKENFVGSVRPSGNFQMAGPNKMTVYDPNDVARTTIKESNIHNNRTGNVQSGPKKLTIYDPNDIAKKTIKESNIHNNRTGNMNGGSFRGTVYDPNNIARTTIKETNIHDNRTGNIQNGPQKGTIYDPNDITRTTIKETNIHDNRTGNIQNGPQKGTIYDPNDITRMTIKETNIHDNRTGNIQSGPQKGTIYDPNDITRMTIKETNIHDNRTGNIQSGPQKGTIYDPNDITRMTIKETNIHDNRTGNIQNGPQRSTVYDPNDITRMTIKETNIHDNRTGNIQSGPQKGTIYDPNDITRTTIKETNIHDNRTGNIQSGPQKGTIYDPNDVTRTTIKETNIHDNRTGNVQQGPQKGTIYDPNDITRTTIKETNIHDNRSGNIQNGPQKGTIYDPNDITRTTIKETNIHDNRTGNVQNGPQRSTVYDPNDITRTTIKETNIHNNRSGNLQKGPQKGTIYDPNDVTRTTIKETNIHDNRTGNVQQGSGALIKPSGVVRDPDDIAKTTIKETLDNEDTDRNLNAVMPSKQPVYDPNDIAKTTIKETNIHNDRSGNFGRGDLVKEGYTTNPKFAPNTNKQFTSDNEYTGVPDGDAMKGGGDGYLTADFKAPNTNKQFTSDIEYTGNAAPSDQVQPMSYEDIYNSTINEVTREKEQVSKGREPTLSNTKISVGEDKINININKLESDIVNTRDLTASKVYNSIPQADICGITSDKNTLDTQAIEDRINPEILKQFKENPYTQPLDSYS
jgi:hypothetical protein